MLVPRAAGANTQSRELDTTDQLPPRLVPSDASVLGSHHSAWADVGNHQLEHRSAH